jgi:CRISPR-associated protein Cmr3
MTIGKDGAPKPMRKMVQAGAVYFVETDAADTTAAAASLWNISLCENEQARRDGFGRILVGNWIE